ncbi:MAG: HAD family hydrolase [Acidobacteriaceae bacterium]|nr:HAD family hydrolase [Acidobacteriaceae bacterium]
MRRNLASWDAYDAFLFDIDGTLLTCTDAVHYFAFCHVLESIAGKPLTLEGVTAHGNTDLGILRDALSLAGVREDTWRPMLPQIQETLCGFVRKRESELCTTILPGVRDVLDHLTGREAVLGVATGNLEAIGQMKLKRAGLLAYFRFGGWSNGFEIRAHVFDAAAAQARSLAGAQASVCVVGDTPADIRAARENGLNVIGVATGIYNRDELAAAQPDLCLNSLAELPIPAHSTRNAHALRA